MFDIYNFLNASPITALNTRFGPAWLTPVSILPARLFKLARNWTSESCSTPDSAAPMIPFWLQRSLRSSKVAGLAPAPAFTRSHRGRPTPRLR